MLLLSTAKAAVLDPSTSSLCSSPSMACGSFYAGGSPIVQSTPSIGYLGSSTQLNHQDSTVSIHHKLDRLTVLFADQNNLMVEAKTETVALKNRVHALSTEVTDLKEKLESSSAHSSLQKKRIPRDLSVSCYTALCHI